MNTSHQKMTSRRFLAVLLLPLILFLASCKVHAAIEVVDENTANTTMTMEMPKDAVSGFGITSCDDLKSEMLDGKNEGANLTDNSDDSTIRCVIEEKGQSLDKVEGDGLTIEHKDGKYIAKAAGDTEAAGMSGMLSGFDFTLEFTFPGAVEKVETTAGEDSYSISGNTVTFKSIKALAEGFTITAAESGGGSSTLWIIIGIVLALILIAVVVALVLLKKKGKSDPNAAQGPSDFPGSGNYGGPQGPGAPQGPSNYGAPQGPGTAGNYGGPQAGYTGPQGGPQQPMTGGPTPGYQPGSQTYGQPASGQSPYAQPSANQAPYGQPNQQPGAAPQQSGWQQPGSQQSGPQQPGPEQPRPGEPTDPTTGFTEPRNPNV